MKRYWIYKWPKLEENPINHYNLFPNDSFDHYKDGTVELLGENGSKWEVLALLSLNISAKYSHFINSYIVSIHFSHCHSHRLPQAACIVSAILISCNVSGLQCRIQIMAWFSDFNYFLVANLLKSVNGSLLSTNSLRKKVSSRQCWDPDVSSIEPNTFTSLILLNFTTVVDGYQRRSHTLQWQKKSYSTSKHSGFKNHIPIASILWYLYLFVVFVLLEQSIFLIIRTNTNQAAGTLFGVLCMHSTFILFNQVFTLIQGPLQIPGCTYYRWW